ncbi:hypothetical protein [Synechocystis salina]|nr:hypothetical protein [Synechocystis salina]
MKQETATILNILGPVWRSPLARGLVSAPFPFLPRCENLNNSF